MTPAPIPKNEVARLKALKKYNILDTPVEKEFEDITNLASMICGTKVSAISLIDRDRQWFKSIHGLDVKETPRDLSFCGHAINEPNEIFVIENAHKDARFAHNPLVENDPGITFYAGAPIVNKEGYALGTLCVFDDKPVDFTEKQKEALRSLSKIALRQLEQRLINTDLESYLEVQTQKLQDAIEDLEEEVNHRKNTEKQLEKALEVEKELSELRANMVHSISHQFKTPLTAISSSAQLVDMMTERTSEKKIKHIERIKNSVKALNKMTEDVTYLQKIDWSKVKQDASKVQVSKLLTEAIQHVTTDLNFNGNIEVDRSLNGEILSNAPMLEKLFQILINNAIQYGGASKIHIELNSANKGFVFIIHNGGESLDADNLKQIFDLFFRGNNANEKAGIGIGLTIARRIVESMGEISMHSHRQKIEQHLRYSSLTLQRQNIKMQHKMQ